jgi:hypothetical protein
VRTVGIDRRQNAVGYHLLNCVPCCTSCNLMKRNTSEQAFISSCIAIAERFMNH